MALASDGIKLPLEHMWIDYDREADVLYLNFWKPQRASKTIETNNDILIRKYGNKIMNLHNMPTLCQYCRKFTVFLKKKAEFVAIASRQQR